VDGPHFQSCPVREKRIAWIVEVSHICYNKHMTIEYLDLGEGVPASEAQAYFEDRPQMNFVPDWQALPEGSTMFDSHPGYYSYRVTCLADGTGRVEVIDRTGIRPGAQASIDRITSGTGFIALNEQQPILPILGRTGEGLETVRYFGALRYLAGPPAAPSSE